LNVKYERVNNTSIIKKKHISFSVFHKIIISIPKYKWTVVIDFYPRSMIDVFFMVFENAGQLAFPKY
jgi:uncharacterized membrane protein YcjF (UPF0283 family)